MNFHLTFILLIATISFAQGATPEPKPQADQSPNVILFLIDDLGWKDLGCQGSEYYKTPNIDALAQSGARFTDAYSACAVCSPTRAAILTGKAPARLLLTEWLPSGRWNPYSKLQSGRYLKSLPVEEVTLAERLRDAGYQTGHVGKWHLGDDDFSSPIHHGFDFNAGGNPHGAPGNYFYPYNGNWSVPSTGRKVKWNVFEEGNEGEYLTDRLTDEAIGFITDNHDKKFFLHFAHYAVHTPLQAKKKMIAKYQTQPEETKQGSPVYAAMVESVDQSIGRVIQTLRDLGIEEETCIIFTSDNGGFYKATENDPLRANKGSYYEGGIRVPLIIKWPGVAEPGSVVHHPVISMDLYPTCLAMTGNPMLPHQHLDGVSLESCLKRNDDMPNRSLFWHYPHYNKHPSSFPSGVIRKGDWKLIQTFDPERVELYNLRTDLSETRSLLQDHPDVAERMMSELVQWRDSVGAEVMRPNPGYDPSKL